MPPGVNSIRSITCRATVRQPVPATRWPSFTGTYMNAYVERLSHLDSCAVSDALDKLGLTGSVTGLGRVSTDQRITGQVRTVKMDRAEGRTSTRHLCTAAIETSNPGDIIVCEQRTGLDAACWGGNLTIAA